MKKLLILISSAALIAGCETGFNENRDVGDMGVMPWESGPNYYGSDHMWSESNPNPPPVNHSGAKSDNSNAVGAGAEETK